MYRARLDDATHAFSTSGERPATSRAKANVGGRALRACGDRHHGEASEVAERE